VRTASILLVFLVLLLAACGGGSDAHDAGNTPPATRSDANAEETAASGEELATVAIEASGGERVEVRAEIADDLSEQARGLMYRTALAGDRGMLFVYDDERERSFWMRNTLIPLSIAYMDSEGRIVDIQDMEPLDDDPPHYVSAEPAQYALEVNQGFFEERGIEVGDRADLPG
jgi:uncharacterized membrane protein (UPF0127 family)